jgi:hypothetical protein
MGNIVWLASYPKSGNTWLRAFIHNLISDTGRPSELHQLTQFFESESRAARYAGHLDRPPSERAFDELVALRPKVQHEIANSVARGSVLTKTHNQLCHYEGTALHNMAITAAGIYVLRNPLDVVISVADHFGLSIDQAIDFMANPNTATESDDQSVGVFLGSWSHHVESWSATDNSQFLTVRYEDMLDKALLTFTQVAKLLGLDGDRAKIKQAIKFSSFKELQQQESRSGFGERSSNSKSFFRQGKQHQWIQHLSEKQVVTIIDQHREMMIKFNYLPTKFR